MLIGHKHNDQLKPAATIKHLDTISQSTLDDHVLVFHLLALCAKLQFLVLQPPVLYDKELFVLGQLFYLLLYLVLLFS